MTTLETEPLLPQTSSSSNPAYQSIPSSSPSTSTPSSSDELAPGQRLDPTTLNSTTSPQTSSERLKSLLKWLTFWFLLSLFLLYLISKAISEGSGEIDWLSALKAALGGGLSGAMAMIIQVITLMPLRTVMNYQYRFGGTMIGSIKLLFNEGGYGRYYAGLGPALFQGPIGTSKPPAPFPFDRY